MTSRMIRRPEVQHITGLPTSTLYDLMSKGLFPRPVKLGMRAVGWPSEAIDNWLEERRRDAAA